MLTSGITSPARFHPAEGLSTAVEKTVLVAGPGLIRIATLLRVVHRS